MGMSGRFGIDDLPPVVQPDLLREANWWRSCQDEKFDISLVHASYRQIQRVVRAFKEFAAKMAPQLFPRLPA
jgi:hypothetical protein